MEKQLRESLLERDPPFETSINRDTLIEDEPSQNQDLIAPNPNEHLIEPEPNGQPNPNKKDMAEEPIETNVNERLTKDEPEPNEYLTADDLPVLRRYSRINPPFTLTDQQKL